MTKFVTASIIGCAILAGCTDAQRGPDMFDLEAGAMVDGGSFGGATMHNALVQTGQQDFVVSLNRRFEAEVPTTINFDFNSARLGAEAQRILTEQAYFIQQFPEVHFRVYGHTDLVGSDSYNKELGLARANAAVAYLISLGVDRSRLEAVVSFGEEQPLIVTEGRERANRRTVTEVSGFVSGNGMVLNGKYAQIVFREYVESAVPRTGLVGISGSEVSTTN
ncbi:OmpA family protein [Marivivens donghaensis]|uniref:OmpA family protein n=1 Tax=Marivivens donghaensis TaxID=1699413 RepID=A0ABX0VXP2_9RHOB|nr:OmpA family protein [Marivivens donghaensis]NIY71987.1 OmpA family protein [Marivivens donghaensis]